jgi:hypothetical protein
MSDAVLIALITNLTIIAVAFLSRLWSHVEHKQNQATIDDTNEKVTSMVNGKY